MSKKLSAYPVACAFILLCAPLWAQGPVSDFDPVLKLKDDQHKFVEAVRIFDRAQGYLSKADQMIADYYMKEDNALVAKAKLKKSNERIANVKLLYQKALVYYPENALLHNYYGELLYDRYGDIPGALVEWNEAISRDSKLSEAYNNLGLHDIHYGNYTMGLKNLETALELEPENPDYLYNLAQMYLVHAPQIGEIKGMEKDKIYKQAMKMSKSAAQFAPDEFELVQDYAVNFFAAENFGLEADWKEAAIAWGTARTIARDDDEKFYTWLNEARVWIKHGDPTQAKRCLSEALTLKPDSEVAKKLLAEQNQIPDTDAPVAEDSLTPVPVVENSTPEIAPAPAVEEATPDAAANAPAPSPAE